jgi:predicted ATPase/DNA-binding SARP family transcriptional activator
MDARWRITLLGGLSAQQGERVITRFRTQKTGALLAHLAFYRDQIHTRESLFELLWPGCVPDLGRQSLSMALSSLRHQLEPPGVPRGAVIIADYKSVRLNPEAVTTDVAEFELAQSSTEQAQSDTERVRHLADAVALYRGALLPDYFENWILREQQRLEGLFFQLLGELIEYYENADDLPRALDYAHHGVAIDPLREEAHYELIRLYAAAGQPTAALRQYAELERLLREEFEDAPTDATRELARRISHQLSVTSEQLAIGRRQLAVRRRQLAEGRKQKDEDIQPSSVTPSPLHPFTPSFSRLPLTLTRFFGREKEIAWLLEQLTLEDTRLVTLTGTGGTGKTRLAIEVAKQLVEPLRGAVWFVPLADLSDAKLIEGALLEALHIPRSPNVEPLEQVVEVLSRQPSLLVLDNLEHLLSTDLGSGLNGLVCDKHHPNPLNPLPKSVDTIRTLLERVPTLKLLVTSRQRLGLDGEREFYVPPLPTPSHPSSLIPHPSSLMMFASVQLFVDRAQAVRPDFQVTDANAQALAELCERLEGIPLAIELAAARALVMSPAQMLAQLEHRFDFLVSRRRDVAERHRTLRAAIDWSYRLLASELQQFFVCLSVFRGGWTLEAAEAVTSDEWRVASDTTPDTRHPTPDTPDVLDVLEQLRECSLILCEETAGAMRFRMLETIREYCWEKWECEAPAELRRVRGRHLEFFTRLAEQANEKWASAERGAWFQRLDADYDNVRAALEWGLESDPAKTLHLTQMLFRFWEERGHIAEGREWVSRALAAAPDAPPALRAGALNLLGVLTRWQGDYAQAVVYGEEALRLHRQTANQRGVAVTLGNLALYAQDLGDFERARVLYDEVLQIARELDVKVWIAIALNNLGDIAVHEGDYERADDLQEESLTIAREIGNKAIIAASLTSLGEIAEARGDLERAWTLYEESLTIAREQGIKHREARVLHFLGRVAYRQGDPDSSGRLNAESLKIWRELGVKGGIAEDLDWMAMVASAQNQAERAAVLFAAAAALRESVGVALSRFSHDEHDARLAAARAALGDKAFAAAWAKGRALTLEQAVAYALEAGKR